MNASDLDLEFKLPNALRWAVVFDTANDAAMFELQDESYLVRNRAAVLINAIAEPDIDLGEM